MNLRDAFPAPPLADRGPISFDPDHPSNVAARARVDAALRDSEAKWLPLHTAIREHADGLLLRLVDIHRPDVNRLNALNDHPWCSYCTYDDAYGMAERLWPCPEIRVIASELGVDLPPDPDDDL